MATNGTAVKGKAVVTGASAGIGKMYAERLAERGYDLVLVARRAERLQAIQADLKARFGVGVETITADLVDADDRERVAKQLEADEAIQMLVNNAGTTAAGAVADGDAGRFEKLVALNSVAPLRLAMAVLPGFKRRNSGTLINLGSVVGEHPYVGFVVYSATKAFLHSFTTGLAAELEGTGVRVQLVAPAVTESEILEATGMSPDAFPKEVTMTTAHCVDAALKGLDAGEVLTFPSLEDASLVQKQEQGGMAILMASQTARPASRYGL